MSLQFWGIKGALWDSVSRSHCGHIKMISRHRGKAGHWKSAALAVSAVRSAVQLRARPRAPPSTRMVSFILCLLPALLATSAQASTLTCKTCAGSADVCRTARRTCRVDTATGGCCSVAEEITLEGIKTTGFASRCTNNDNMGVKDPVTLTLGNDTYLRINTTWCNTDNNCNSAVPEVPKGSTTLNGLQCPTCFALDSDHCNSHIAPCTGDETYCIDFAGMAWRGTKKSTFVAKGCATASTKVIKVEMGLVSALSTFTFTKATSQAAEKITPTTKPPAATTRGASPALGRFSFAFYLPGLTGLLLVKLFP
ncbi:phospholipase A2 inhibitor and Ly6/PLAUR domain-containing protein-like [Mauremys mutica]|uniref:phospholipase A2 inhibitor and Ly6/PLAUR domain-containing protein-like n=1 Tax=Mauremys mutica TaxID=74926 RepID=UPI001D16C058|nr:phospholipase A2 inhibitor and Ly6/PLAUR domain-containing protein-like [Mauremys mutica]